MPVFNKPKAGAGNDMNNKRQIILLIICVFLFPITVSAASLREALDKAATYFKQSGKIDPEFKISITGILNFHSKARDSFGEKIETELYFAIERKLPEVRILDIKESVTGVSGKNAVFLKGTYEQKGEITILRLQAIKGTLSGEIQAQTTVEFETGKAAQKTLVAVLDLEAKTLNDEQRKAFSDIFRSALGNIGRFDIASSAEIDKMNPEVVMEKTTGLYWQRKDENKARTWDDAISYCRDLSLGGHSDWRLPEIDELRGLLYCSRGPANVGNNDNCNDGSESPTINQHAFPGTNSSSYWSSTTYADYTRYAWFVYFIHGMVSYNNKSGHHHVRCVRDGQQVFTDPVTNKQFVLINPDVVMEKTSGLYWQREDDDKMRN